MAAIDTEEAIAILRRFLRDTLARATQQSVFIRPLTFSCLSVAQRAYAERYQENGWPPPTEIPGRNDSVQRTVLHQLIDGCWELVRRGLLLPTPYFGENQPTRFDGVDFRVTPHGERWALESDDLDVWPVEHDRFARLLDARTQRFGSLYRSRALEALRCYHATAYLATCTMSGAAAESVVLVVGAAKFGIEDVQKRYRNTKDRTKLVDAICANVKGAVHDAFVAYVDVLKYWRDDAAHASAATIGELEAMTSLLYLANLARLIDDRWNDIV